MKANKFINVFCVLGISLVSLCSCEDFLNRKPLDQISQETFWRTPEQLDSYIVGKYNWLPGQLSDWGMGYFVADVTSDDMIQGTIYNSWMNGENNVTPTSGGGWDWGAIREINMFFDNYHLCEAPFEQYKSTYGEACFLKAYAYHSLVMKFGDVPWYSSVISDNDDEALMKSRDKRSMVVDSIMNLIDKSIEYLPTYSEVGGNRLNKETALIYKSRVALFEASWAKYHKGTPSASDVDSEVYFGKVIEAYNQYKELFGEFEGKLYSTGNPDIDYYNLFNRFDYTGIEEVTLWKKYSQALGIPNNINYICWNYGYGNCSYTLSLIQSYLSKDGKSIDVKDENEFKMKGRNYLIELSNKLDPRFSQSVFIPGDLLNSVTNTYKDSCFYVPQLHMADQSRNTTSGFAPKKGHNPEGPMENQTDPLISGIGFRIAEILLNYAEAYVELNGTFPDFTDNIDLLRRRVGMPTLTSIKPKVDETWPNYGYPISDELAIIRQERRVELAGEGYRTNDWKRWRAHRLFEEERPKGFRFEPMDYENIGIVSLNLKTDENGYLDPYFTSLNGGLLKFNAERDYLSPIPLNELIINKNLNQNPGWDKP